MNSNCERKSAADLREKQKQMIAQAEAVQKTVAVMEPNWQALIASQKQQVETLAQILEKQDALATQEDLFSMMGQQLKVLTQWQQAMIDVAIDHQKAVSKATQGAQTLMQTATKAIEVRSGQVSEKFSKTISEEQEHLRKWMIKCLLISLIPSLLLVSLELILHFC